jgi:hypothetical protein
LDPFAIVNERIRISAGFILLGPNSNVMERIPATASGEKEEDTGNSSPKVQFTTPDQYGRVVLLASADAPFLESCWWLRASAGCAPPLSRSASDCALQVASRGIQAFEMANQLPGESSQGTEAGLD